MRCDEPKRKGTYVIGLTGGIASGKSTVSRFLSRLGAVVIDVDIIAREVTSPGSLGLRRIIEAFGQEFLFPDGSLDRKKLAQLVFHDKGALKLLNSIVHPLVMERVEDILEALSRKSQIEGVKTVVVLDAPLLLEAGADRLVDEVWVVSVDEKTQMERLMKREGFSREEALSRIRSQMPQKEKEKRADRIIDNSKTPEETEKIVKAAWTDLKRKISG